MGYEHNFFFKQTERLVDIVWTLLKLSLWNSALKASFRAMGVLHRKLFRCGLAENKKEKKKCDTGFEQL